MRTVYALLWKSTSSQAEFEAALPRLMEWLRELKKDGRLLGCGGFANEDGGLTLIDAQSLEQARAVAAASPQSTLGATTIFEWEVYDAALKVESSLAP
jgi:uncharacterized protein YciI